MLTCSPLLVYIYILSILSLLIYAHTHNPQFDADRNGHITVSEIGDVLKALGESVPGYKIRDMVKEVDIDENGTVEFNEFLKVSSIWSKCFFCFFFYVVYHSNHFSIDVHVIIFDTAEVLGIEFGNEFACV